MGGLLFVGRPLLMDSNDQHRQKNEDFISSFFFFAPFFHAVIHSRILSLFLSLLQTLRPLSLTFCTILSQAFTNEPAYGSFFSFFLSPSRSLPLNYVFTLATLGAHGFRPPFGSISNVVKLKRKKEGKVLGDRGE